MLVYVHVGKSLLISNKRWKVKPKFQIDMGLINYKQFVYYGVIIDVQQPNTSYWTICENSYDFESTCPDEA